MQLLSQSNSVKDTTFRTQDGSLTYILQTSGWPSRKTQISKLGHGGSGSVGKVQLHSFSEDELIVNRKKITPERAGFLSSKRQFVASNNQRYTWKASPREATLKDDQKRVIAVFERGSHGLIRETRPASLQIADAAIPIADEIFATFIYMQQKVRQRSNAVGASGGGVGDGGGGGGGC